MLGDSRQYEAVQWKAHWTPRWVHLADEELLDWRLCDLGLSIGSSNLPRFIQRLYRRLGRRGLLVRPQFWFSDEWFCPEGLVGIAVPFYLAHPRLAHLELSQMGQVEGGTAKWCEMLIRHEMGHAIDHAFHLHRRKGFQRFFGSSSQPYPQHYSYLPYSRDYVKHLEEGYAQSHPDEDFAETFAVWLDSKEHWKAVYGDWSAIKKLEYMDRLMTEVKGRVPFAREILQIDPVGEMNRTLREHYRRRKMKHQETFWDQSLKERFSQRPVGPSELSERLAPVVEKMRKEICREVSHHLGFYQYQISGLIDKVIERSQVLNLRSLGTESETKKQVARMLVMKSKTYFSKGCHQIPL